MKQLPALPRRRALLALLVLGMAPIGCGDPDAGTVDPDVTKEGGASRLKRLEQFKDEAAAKTKKGGR